MVKFQLMSNLSHQQLVQDFMVLMEQWSPSDPKVNVSSLSDKDTSVAKLRLKLITEELSELFEAFLSQNMYSNVFAPLFNIIQSKVGNLETKDFEIDKVAAADAITDQDYINSGTGVWLGLPLEACFKAVHENNLTKVDPVTGKVIKRPDGKVIKPDTYVPVDLTPIVLNDNQ